MTQKNPKDRCKNTQRIEADTGPSLPPRPLPPACPCGHVGLCSSREHDSAPGRDPPDHYPYLYHSRFLLLSSSQLPALWLCYFQLKRKKNTIRDKVIQKTSKRQQLVFLKHKTQSGNVSSFWLVPAFCCSTRPSQQFGPIQPTHGRHMFFILHGPSVCISLTFSFSVIAETQDAARGYNKHGQVSREQHQHGDGGRNVSLETQVSRKVLL